MVYFNLNTSMRDCQKLISEASKSVKFNFNDNYFNYYYRYSNIGLDELGM